MINKVKVIGTLVGTGRGFLGYNEIIVRIEKRGQKKYNVSLVLEITLTPDVVVGAKVEIDGIVRAVRMSDLDGKTKVVQYLAARSVRISHKKSSLQKEYGIVSYNKKIDDFTIILEGLVREVRSYGKPNQMLIMEIEDEKRRRGTVSVLADTKDIPYLRGMIHEKDTVIVSAITQASPDAKPFVMKKDIGVKLYIDDIGIKKRAKKKDTPSQSKAKEVKMNPKRSVELPIEILPPEDDQPNTDNNESDFDNIFE